MNACWLSEQPFSCANSTVPAGNKTFIDNWKEWDGATLGFERSAARIFSKRLKKENPQRGSWIGLKACWNNKTINERGGGIV